MDSLTREPADLRTHSRPRRWLVAVLCVLVITGIGYAIWFWPAGSGGQAGRNRNANQPIPVLVAAAEQKERKQLAEDLHDDSIQVVTAAVLRVQVLRNGVDLNLFKALTPEARDTLLRVVTCPFLVVNG